MTGETSSGPRLRRSRQKVVVADDSLTRLVAPVFAGFSLPAIIIFSTASFPGQPWHDAVLSLLIAATGLFMGSIQLSIGRLYDKYDGYKWMRSLRALLTIGGIALVACALTFLVWPEVRQWWIWLPLGVLLLGGFGPGIWTLLLRSEYRVGGQLQPPLDAQEVEVVAPKP